MAKQKTKRKVGWMEPYWFHIPRYRDELRRSGVFGLKFWARPIALSASFLALAVGYIWWRYPGAWLPIPRLMIGLFVFPPLLMAVSLIYWVVPRNILVTPRRIVVSHGNSAYRIEAGQVRRVALECSDPARLVLRVEYETRRHGAKELTAGLSRKVDPNRIAECLPDGLAMELVGQREIGEPDLSNRSPS